VEPSRIGPEPPTPPSVQDERLVLLCPRCRQPGAFGHPFCAHCGTRLIRPARRWRRAIVSLWAAAIALGAAIALVRQTPFPATAVTLAGIHVGEASSEVVTRLGHPQRRPREVFWNAPDGTAHRVGIWQYGITPGTDDVADLTVTFLDGHVYQVGVLAKGYRTSEGLHVGDRLPKARQIYGTAIEEDPIAGLVPIKFLRGEVVVKVVTMPGDNEVLALGIESPLNLPAVEAETPTHRHFSPDVPTNAL